jgi:hypothetical protein
MEVINALHLDVHVFNVEVCVQGSMVGPMIGGALSYPCSLFAHFPLCEKDALFERRYVDV